MDTSWVYRSIFYMAEPGGLLRAPALRPLKDMGLVAKNATVQICSRQICRTSYGSNPPGEGCKSVALIFLQRG